MPSTLPNPDTILYPADDPRLVLSVSDQIPDWILQSAPIDVYTETLLVRENAISRNRKHGQALRLRVFTHNLSIAGPERVTIGVPGETGGWHAEKPSLPHEKQKQVLFPDGFCGGSIELYVGNADPKTSNSLLLDASGGDGFDPPPTIDEKVGKSGGKGGDGGDVFISYSTAATTPLRKSKALLEELVPGSQSFPFEFRDETNELIRLSKGLAHASDLDQLQSALNAGRKEEFRYILAKIWTHMKSIIDVNHAALTQVPNVNPGFGGRGAPGSEESGPQGKQGVAGQAMVNHSSAPEDIWNTNVCFVHPVQCRMLLDMAKLHFYVDGDENLGKSKILLERLQERLMFLNFIPSEPAKSSLLQAFRDAEPRLFLPSGPTTELWPSSIKNLITVKNEVNSVLALLSTSKDFYGYDRNYVPRRRFNAYEKNIADELKAVRKAEDLYLEYASNMNEADKKSRFINKSLESCDSAQASNESLVQLAVVDISNNILKIQSLTEPMKFAYESLKRETAEMEFTLKNSMKVPASSMIQALGMCMFVPYGLMVPVEAMDLLHQMFEQLPSDNDVQINKDYLLQRFHEAKGSLESVHEGYSVAKDGKIDLLDPGATKLRIKENELISLLSQYRNVLGGAKVTGLVQRFNEYTSLVLKRNDAVLRYNAALVVIARARIENAAHEQTREDLKHMRTSTLSTGNPMMTLVMKNAYLAAVQRFQFWLYKAQRSYNFEATNLKNILGYFFRSIDTSQYTHGLMVQANQALVDAYEKYLEKQSNSRFPFPTVRYQLDEGAKRRIARHGNKKAVYNFHIATPLEDRNSPFAGMADIRLTRARMFLPGAKTTSGFLHITLTHLGDETIVGVNHETIQFVHDIIHVSFKYNLDTKDHTGEGTLPGVVGETEDPALYALPGPFAVWQLEINPEFNSGLDLSSIAVPYLEFEGVFRSSV